jgi:hypothetical protein
VRREERNKDDGEERRGEERRGEERRGEEREQTRERRRKKIRTDRIFHPTGLLTVYSTVSVSTQPHRERYHYWPRRAGLCGVRLHSKTDQ